VRSGAVNDNRTILPASPVFIRIAAIASCLLAIIGVAVAVYAYGVLPHPSTVHHLGRAGETTESIESYIFGPLFIQVLTAVVLTIKWLRWSGDVRRMAERDARDRARDPGIPRRNIDAMYRIFCVAVVVFEVLLLCFVVYRAVVIATNSL
jgi:hypothetical protein